MKQYLTNEMSIESLKPEAIGRGTYPLIEKNLGVLPSVIETVGHFASTLPHGTRDVYLKKYVTGLTNAAVRNGDYETARQVSEQLAGLGLELTA